MTVDDHLPPARRTGESAEVAGVLPHSPTGKVLKHDLRVPHWS